VAKWKEEKIASFSYHLKTMLESGISLMDSLHILKSQSLLPEKAGQILINSIQQGESLSTALRIIQLPVIFCAFVEAAEHHGDIQFALTQCHQYYQARAKWTKRIKQVMFYPFFILCFLCVGLLFLSLVVLPTFAELYQSFAFELPWTTRMVFSLSEVLPYLLLAGFAIGIGVILARRTPLFQQIISRLPLVTTYYRYRYTQYLSLQLGSFITAGVPMLPAFILLERITPWPPLCQFLTSTKEQLIAGESLTGTVRNHSKTLLPVFSQTVILGEETGKLGEMLGQLAITTEEWLTEKLEKWMTYLEPLLTLIMGFIMVIVVISLFIPMFGLINAVQ
jgi:type II secretory pathway component PulF